LDRAEVYGLSLILCLALAVRIVGAYLTKVLIFDEWLYCTQAYSFAFKGELPTIFPLTPIIMSLFIKTLGPSKWSYLATTIGMGTILIIPIYKLASRYLDKKLSLTVALLTASNPMFIWTSSHALTEPLFMVLLTSSLLLSLEKEAFKVLIAGLLVGLAYLCRYPALLLVIVVIIHLYREKEIKKMLLYTVSFVTVFVSWQVTSILATGTLLQTEYYSLLYTLGGVHTIDLGAIQPMLFKVSMGLTLMLLPLIPLLPYLKLERENVSLLLQLVFLWLLFHLGYYVYQSFNTYTSLGQVVASERIARWSSPIFPFISIILLRKTGRWFKALLIISVVLSIAIGLYLVEYTNSHAMLQESWESFLEKLGVTP